MLEAELLDFSVSIRNIKRTACTACKTSEWQNPPLSRHGTSHSGMKYLLNNKILKYFAAFFLSWCPYTIVIVLNYYSLIKYGGYFYILLALAPLNSVANPIVFLAFNQKRRNKYTPTKSNGSYGSSIKSFSSSSFRNSMQFKTSMIVMHRE